MQGDAAIIQAASTAFDSAYLVVMLVVAGVQAVAAALRALTTKGPLMRTSKRDSILQAALHVSTLEKEISSHNK